MSRLIERLRRHWMDEGLAVGNGAAEAQIAALESKHHIILPDDFREYLLSISVDEDWLMGNFMISFWTLKRIAEEFPLIKKETIFYLAFADFLIDSHFYAIQLQPQPSITSPVFFVYGDAIQIANSFTEFLERYINNDENMLFLK